MVSCSYLASESSLWIRPLVSIEYAFGKGLAAILVGLIVAFPSLIAGWSMVSIIQNQPQPLNIWFAMSLVAIMTDILASLFALLIINLTPWPLLGALLSTGTILYLGFFKTQTLLDITDVLDGTLYASSSIGFGPDQQLLIAQRILYLAISMFFLVFLALLFHFKERRGAVLRISFTSTILALLLVTILTLSTFVNFVRVASSYQRLGPPVSAPINTSISHYQLAITLDPESGLINGKAKFVLTPHIPYESRFFFALNPGLQIQKVTFEEPLYDGNALQASPDVALPFISSFGWTKVELSKTSFAQGRPVLLAVEYSGNLSLSRDSYALPMQTFGSAQVLGVNEFQDYAGQGIALLEGSGSGDWYPLPWTQQAIDAYGNRQAFESVQIRVPSAYKVFCSLARPESTGGGLWQIIDVHPNGVLPMAFFVALTSSNQTQISNVPVFFQGIKPFGQVDFIDREMVQQVQEVDTLLAPQTTSYSWVAVIMPLIQRPVVGPGLLLLPEMPLLDNISYSSIASYRVPAQVIAEAWWLNAVELRNSGFRTVYPSLQNPDGGVTFPLSSPQLFNMLSSYVGAVITNIHYPNALVNEMAVRQLFHKNPNTADPQQAFTLGIDCCGMTDPPLILFNLERKLGMAQVTKTLRQFIQQYAQIPGSIGDFLTLASSMSGFDVLPMSVPYLCPGIVSETTGSKLSLSCLNGNAQVVKFVIS